MNVEELNGVTTVLEVRTVVPAHSAPLTCDVRMVRLFERVTRVACVNKTHRRATGVSGAARAPSEELLATGVTEGVGHQPSPALAAGDDLN